MKKHLVVAILLVLFKVSSSAQLWTWMSGDSNGATQPLGYVQINYGIKKVSASTNTSGTRYRPAYSQDSKHNLWVYSGQPGGGINFETWKYNPNLAEWTWMHGPVVNANNTHKLGTMGIGDTTILPYDLTTYGVMATDSNDNMWLFHGLRSMLFKYNTNLNYWTWMNGDTNFGPPVYGTQGVPSVSNKPEYSLETLTFQCHKKTNTLWYFDSKADFWRYNIATNEWTWMTGNHNLMYDFGTKFIESPNVLPSFYRFIEPYSHISWMDQTNDYFYMMDDLYFNVWRYNINTNLWAWVGGVDTGVNVYPATPSSYPIDSNCLYNLGGHPKPTLEARAINIEKQPEYTWIYGGFDSSALWIFDANKGILKYIEQGPLDYGYSYGIKKVTSPSNKPFPSEGGLCLLTDKDDNLWTFNTSFTSDIVWKYEPDYCCLVNINHADSFKSIKLKDTIICENTLLVLPFANSKLYTISSSDSTKAIATYDSIYFLPNSNLNNASVTINFTYDKLCPFDTSITFLLSTKICKDDTTYTTGGTGGDTTIKDSTNVHIPNVFSPNGDGLNDKLFIIGKNYNLINFSIFNRFGERIFYTTNKQEGWDGNYKNSICDIGNYYYVIKYFENNKEKMLKGDVALVR
jgi:gliding motility-associated-like protein